LLNAPALSEQRIAEIEETRDGAPPPPEASGVNAPFCEIGAEGRELWIMDYEY
jgi:hypothetical protein